MNPQIYLDHASATPVRPAAAAAQAAALDAFADPLQSHAPGRHAAAVLEAARQTVADGLGAQADEIVFTSGGTESVALALIGAARARRADGTRIVIGAIEHPSVGAAGRLLAEDGVEVATVGVDEHGRLDTDAFMTQVRVPGTILASVQHANHEVGTLQPVAEATRLARESGVTIHCDAAQTAGRLPIDVHALDVDLLTISGHKFGAPPGIGALYVGRGVPLAGFPPGDVRERHRRAGAENLPGAVAMAAAMTDALDELADQAAAQWALTDLLRSGLDAIASVSTHGHPTQRAPHLVCFSADGVDPDVLLMALDERGFRLSCGCIERGLAGEASPVLKAMGIPDTVGFRASVGRETTREDIERFLAEITPLIEELHRVEHASRRSLARGDADG
ncbi:MAG: cysteine desulfurase family protein [Actinomycetota bacterium]